LLLPCHLGMGALYDETVLPVAWTGD